MTDTRPPLTLYRYADSIEGHDVDLLVFDVLRATPAGYWFVDSWTRGDSNAVREQEKRWVSATARKRYCYPSKIEAWTSYCIRKRRQLMHLEKQHEMAKKRVAALAGIGVDPPREAHINLIPYPAFPFDLG